MSGVSSLALEKGRTLLNRARDRRLSHAEILELEACLQILELDIKDLTTQNEWRLLKNFKDLWRTLKNEDD